MRKGELNKYAKKSDLMEIHVTYGSEEFHFNLNSEIIVDEDKINQEIMDQPSSYAFLAMLHKKLIRKAQDKKKEMEKDYASMFIKFKGEKDLSTGKPMANDLAEQKAINSTKYQNSIEDYLDAQHEADIIGVCVETFQQRSALIQTLSANIRKNN